LDVADAEIPDAEATFVAAPPHRPPVAAASAKVTTDSAVLGGVAVAKQAIEFLAAVIGLIGGLGVLVGWLS
jgi:hypothetical protein